MLWWLQNVACYLTQNATDHERDCYINWHKPPEEEKAYVRALEQSQRSRSADLQLLCVQYFLLQGSERGGDATHHEMTSSSVTVFARLANIRDGVNTVKTT